MRIAFHAPLKSPDHPVPSGDRLMGRLLLAALRLGGHQAEVVSDLRPYLRDPAAGALAGYQLDAQAEIARIGAIWQREGAPDLWFSYHPYCKAPDLLGPPLCRRFGLPYVTAESSWSVRRNTGDWAQAQALVAEGARLAAVNLCLTARDRAGLAYAVPDARLADLPPFIDTAAFAALTPRPEPGHLVTVAMMRPGDKLSSYRALAAALARLDGPDWRLSIIGDGAAEAEVRTAFAPLPAERIHWHGRLDGAGVAQVLSCGAIYAWPGHAEAYGLAYLEAQAMGLPVVAEAVAGVPEVVRHGVTGFLTPPGDTAAYAAAMAQLLTDGALRAQMAQVARRFVLEDRSLTAAAARLADVLGGLA